MEQITSKKNMSFIRDQFITILQILKQIIFTNEGLQVHIGDNSTTAGSVNAESNINNIGDTDANAIVQMQRHKTWTDFYTNNIIF